MTPEKLATGLKWLLGIPVIMVLGHYSYELFAGLSVLAGLVGAVAVGVAATRFAPAVSSMLSNQAMKLLRWDIRNNPIETRYARYQDESKKVNEEEAALKELSGLVEETRSYVEGLERDYPEEGPTYRAHLTMREDELEGAYQDVETSKANLAAYAKETEKMRRIWEVALASNKLDKKASAIAQKDALAQIKDLEAKSAVSKELSTSIANLQHRRRLREAANVLPKPTSPALAHTPADIIEMPVTANQEVKVMKK